MMPSPTSVIVVTTDTEIEAIARVAFKSTDQTSVSFIASRVIELDHARELGNASALVIELDATCEQEVVSLLRLMTRIGDTPVLVVMHEFNEDCARMLSRMGAACSLAKPLQVSDLESAYARTIEGGANRESQSDAQVYTFLPVVGGAGVTTLAIQTAMLLLRNSQPRKLSSTCLIDLDFQNGAIADYLDLEPRLALGELEPRPERLDRQMLEVMISEHTSGLAVVAAPYYLTQPSAVNDDIITRLLDLISSHFEYIVIDMPRGWFPWTKDVLLGSNKLFLVSNMTVPTLRRTKRFVTEITNQCADGPKPQVIINCFEQRLFSTGLRRSDLDQTLGASFSGTVPYNYVLVREAIDRGVPLDDVKSGNEITRALKSIILPQDGRPTTRMLSLKEKLQLSLADNFTAAMRLKAPRLGASTNKPS